MEATTRPATGSRTPQFSLSFGNRFVFDRHFTSLLSQQATLRSVLEMDSDRHYPISIIRRCPRTHVRLNGLNGAASQIKTKSMLR
jgi:hypothetical protein